MMLESISFIERILGQGPLTAQRRFWRFAIKKAISEKLGIGIMAEAAPPRRAADLRRGPPSELADR